MSNIRKMKLTNLDDDTFFNILGYSCESKRLVTLNSNYEVHIGACYEWTAEQRGMYQEAKLPDLTSLSYDKKSYYESHKENSNYEKLIWEPKISEKEYTNFIRESRELVSNICAKNSNNNNNQINNEGNSGSYSERDEITFNSLNTLYHCNMSTTKAIQMLGKNPMPVPVMAKWPDDEVKIFTKGLKSFGKNFSKIKRNYFQHKTTQDLVEFYYLWKKTNEGKTNRLNRYNKFQSKKNALSGGNRRYVLYNGNNFTAPTQGRYSPLDVDENSEINETSTSTDEELIKKNFSKYGVPIDPYSISNNSTDYHKYLTSKKKRRVIINNKSNKGENSKDHRRDRDRDL